jgi:hypothetical protein
MSIRASSRSTPLSANSVASYAYSDNYLINLRPAVVTDVEATTAIRQAEVGAAKTMLDRTADEVRPHPVTPGRRRRHIAGRDDRVVADEGGSRTRMNLIDS